MLEDQEFFSIKIKRQIYLGQPAVAIYIKHATKKIKEKLAQLQLREEMQE